jgi:hypothetical protein
MGFDPCLAQRVHAMLLAMAFILLPQRMHVVAWNSSKTVVVTLWGASAEEDGGRLERLDDAALSIASCRVTDFAGARVWHLHACHPVLLPRTGAQQQQGMPF